MARQQSKRATFEDVRNSQKKLRKLLDILIKENRCLNENERNKYFDLIANSTLGVGVDLAEHIMIEDNIGFKHDFGNIEYFLGWVAYQTTNPIIIGKKPDTKEIQMQKIWEEIRDMFFKIRGHALKMSVKISAEQVKIHRSTPHEI